MQRGSHTDSTKAEKERKQVRFYSKIFMYILL